ncbi:MAG TPA: TonB-dependent receptor [Opitutaceae bacterium]|nr:TonB-dependent receptor [Opitutaceae bacterium]
MTVFTVSTEKDVGYRASNSIAGTRTNTAIKDVPLNIYVFTKDFMDDLGMTNQIDLERYNASVINGGGDVHSDNPIQQAFNAFLFRGFVQNWSLRDGIREYDPIDTQGLSRVELVKGPAAPMYGLAYPGGIMNNITKDVDYRRSFTSIRLTAQSEGEYRVALDANYTAKVGGGAFGVRYNGANVQSKDIREHSEGGIRYSQVSLGWAPFRTTELKFIAETGYREKPNGLGATGTGGYFQRGETDAAGVGLNNGASIPLQITHPEIPWTWNWSTGNNMRSLDTKLYRGTINQSFGDNIQVSGYVQYSDRQQIDGNGWDANGSGGGDSWEAGGGWIIDPVTKKETIQSGYSYRDWSNSMHAYGATAIYKVDFGPIKNTFSFGANVWSEKFVSRSGTQAGSPNQQLLIFDVKAGIDTTQTPPPPTDFHPVNTGNGFSHQDNSNDYYFAGWQLSAMENRLKGNISFNHTNLKLVNWTSGVDNAPTSAEQSKNSPLFGIMFDVTKEVSIWANHATSLFPNSLRNSFGVLLPAIVGDSYEGGLKLDLMQGKISGTVSYYNIKQTGGSQLDPTAENLNTQRWDAMSAAQRAIAFPGQTRNDIRGDQVNGAESESKGFEADLIFSPNRNWQLLLSYANNTNKITKAIATSTIGQSNIGSIKSQFAALGRYSFTEGDLKGLYLGAGTQLAGRSLQGYFNGTMARYYPKSLYVEAFGGYRFKIHGYSTSVQVNVKNLTKQEDYVGWQATRSATVIATKPYEVPTAVRYALTFGLDF